jgi:predicted dehydrogenase/threonine dehydrogenase-like Zn-dependent dehydrogenase
MKQVVQNLGNGETSLEDIPTPMIRPGYVLIKTRRSLVSAGTERMLVGFARAGILGKVIRQEAKAKMVLDKIRSDGLIPTARAVLNKLEQPIALGYCNAGEVIGVGENVSDISLGDMVASNGPHAEVVCVSRNLLAKIPENVTADEAVFMVPGAIGLQGIRLLGPSLGETVVVIGLGLIGLLTAQLLLIHGCQVVGMDPDESRLKIAESKGMITFNPGSGNAQNFILNLTNGVGVDGVIIAASSTRHDVISQAAKMSRKRGKIVLIGDVGLNINRADFYENELTFQVSCSYGPGRYDTNYEEKGLDYPVSHIRWTANRNFQEILRLLSLGRLNVKPLITESVPLTDFKKVYSDITRSKSIATIFEYPDIVEQNRVVRYENSGFQAGKGVIGIIGAGNFTRSTLLPALRKTEIKYIASAGGLSGATLAKKYKIPVNTTDYLHILDDQAVDLVMIATRHHLHARLVIDSLKAGKHVFVEKPLAIFENELADVITAFLDSKSKNVVLTVGFNRRFSPHVQKMKALLGQQAMNVIITVNAGFLAMDSWVRDRDIGGGRIIGEVCHFIDLAAYLTGSRITTVFTSALEDNIGETSESVSIFLKFENGSKAAIHYFSNGHKALMKERVEVHANGQSLILENFQKLTGYGFKGFSKMSTSQDKGHRTMFEKLLHSIRSNGEAIMSFDEIVNTSKATFAALASLKSGGWILV